MIPLVALALAALAPAADPPKKLVELYGEVADPKSKAVCVLVKGDALRVTVPRSFAKDDDKPPFVLPPLTTKPIDGDFEAVVRVRHTPPKGGTRPDGLKQPAAAWAGITLHVEGDPKTNVTAVHKHVTSGGKWKSGLTMLTGRPEGDPINSSKGEDPTDKPVYLRLARRGDEFTADSSADGRKWVRLGQHPVKQFGTKVVVGLVAGQNTTTDSVATFDHYELKPLKAEKK